MLSQTSDELRVVASNDPDTYLDEVAWSGAPEMDLRCCKARWAANVQHKDREGLGRACTCWNSCEMTCWKRSTTCGLGGGGPWPQITRSLTFLHARSYASNTGYYANVSLC